ncbi:Vacuolar protein sorting-associated protein 9b [Pseudocercospora fuligena]|uniref:Vacuolar protein sorting-associated protein 9b n=1 Tax=Pseudocercospora fuligena TaxID=685502 RepID=A0A8H6RI93_9PEZI|nr:Vacuolar protein sorting-associated protein 9b [Pseudocercospora fuligena]
MAETQTSPAMPLSAPNRPQPLHLSRSFTRMPDQPPSPQASSPRKRASTLHEAGIPSVPEARHIPTSPEIGGQRAMADVFENNEEEEHSETNSGAATPGINVPSTFDELPIEIRSLCERFLERLSAKVHDKPLTAEQVSELFQEFYERAANHVATHIATLASKIGRQTPPAQSKTKGRSRAGSGAKKVSTDSLFSHAEMLTADEVADRKKARRLLEQKRVALEEAVERGVCEKVYDKIWQHRSTEDEARDEKLRSRTQSLALVGIGLKELHMDNDPANADIRRTAEEKEDEINQALSAARDALLKMDGEHYPLGKLQHLTAAHKAIVETLSQLFPSSSSADEILPTLIYTLITCPAQGVNAVSNLAFIQRFRTSSKVDGEAAYCLVNLEAAISFLETVDLSSLRSDELPQGPDAKVSSQPSTPKTETPPSVPMPTSAETSTPSVTAASATPSDRSNSSTPASKALSSSGKPSAPSRPQMHQRRISALMAQQAERIEAGRDNFLNAADKFYDSVNGTLDNSLQFLLGRFKEEAGKTNASLPKTLEDARKLVSPISGPEEDAESLSISGRSSPGLEDPLSAGGKSTESNKMLELLGGKKQIRERSVDSTRSGGSGRRAVTFDSKTAAGNAAAKDKPSNGPPTPSGLFNSINPLNNLNKFTVPAFVPRFGRSGSVNSSAQPAPSLLETKSNAVPAGAGMAQGRLGDIVESPQPLRKGSDQLSTTSKLERTRSRDSSMAVDEGDDLNAREALAELRKIKPPKNRFLNVESANQLKIGEVEELLLEYRRLAKAIGEAIAN